MEKWCNASQSVQPNGELTPLALALRDISWNGCECDEDLDEDGVCLPCRCEAALHDQFDMIVRRDERIAELESEVAKLQDLVDQHEV